MNTSSLPLLQQPEVVVLAAGHGGSDSGATHVTFKERDQAITIVNLMAEMLRARGVKVVIAPHEEDTHESIEWVNRRYKFGEAWVIEIHRDSASGLSMEDASKRCGVYTGTSSRSIEVGAFIRQAFLSHGAHAKTWNRLHTESRHGSLGWIRQTVPASHLLELAFMEGDNSIQHIEFLAKLAAAVVYEAFTGFPFAAVAPAAASRGLAKGASKKAARGARAVKATRSQKSSQELLKELADAYKAADLGALFKKLKADVRPEDYEGLKEVTLAQWILESGWAGSKLARQAFNFAGLKYRKELKNYATPYEYTDWEGKTDPYCKFDSVDSFIMGYWAFIQRDVYRGWVEHTDSPGEFIDYLLKCGYTVSDTYKSEVLSLVPKAAVLMA